jgi:hypothetical protein
VSASGIHNMKIINKSLRKAKNTNTTLSSSFFARVLYSGQPLESIYGRMDWVPLSDLLDILKQYVPGDIIGQCNA